MMDKFMQFTALALLAGATACAGMVRDTAQYRDDTQKLLATRNAQLKTCYDEQLKADEKVGGTVTVHFMVEKETGKIVNPTLDQAGTNAPPALGQCVVRALDGLMLVPPDNGNDGLATFVFEFKPNPRQEAPAPAAAPPSKS
jgi:hypothetical protein